MTQSCSTPCCWMYIEIQELDAALLNELVSKIVVHSPVKFSLNGNNAPRSAFQTHPGRNTGSPLSG
ncbi:DUF4368 domain-containing protein [[Clostridium] hylemonae]|uniref:DUF4368 domain-containing protein n=1 Tax=[Clostridium] hylemonae TaxID=89153 RepID=UPI0036F1A067